LIHFNPGVPVTHVDVLFYTSGSMAYISWLEAGLFEKETWNSGRGGGLQAAVYRAKGSKEEYFGLETEATPTSRNQMNFRPSPGR